MAAGGVGGSLYIGAGFLRDFLFFCQKRVCFAMVRVSVGWTKSRSVHGRFPLD